MMMGCCERWISNKNAAKRCTAWRDVVLDAFCAEGLHWGACYDLMERRETTLAILAVLQETMMLKIHGREMNGLSRIDDLGRNCLHGEWFGWSSALACFRFLYHNIRPVNE